LNQDEEQPVKTIRRGNIRRDHNFEHDNEGCIDHARNRPGKSRN